MVTFRMYTTKFTGIGSTEYRQRLLDNESILILFSLNENVIAITCGTVTVKQS